jgi:hypothetical protein
LISAACKHYVPRFLLGYEVIYVDAGDGDRVTKKDQRNLMRAGLKIGLGDSMPDILLWNREQDELWVIEAVCSDGEVDRHKVESLTSLANRCGKKSIGFTTAYCTWKSAASRQGKHKNICPGTHIWIQEDGTKQFTVETFNQAPQRSGQ